MSKDVMQGLGLTLGELLFFRINLLCKVDYPPDCTLLGHGRQHCGIQPQRTKKPRGGIG